MSSPAPRLPNKTGGSTEVLDPKDDEQTLEQQGMGFLLVGLVIRHCQRELWGFTLARNPRRARRFRLHYGWAARATLIPSFSIFRKNRSAYSITKLRDSRTYSLSATNA